MKIYGNYCERVDDELGLNKFKKQYKKDPYEFIFEHELFHISRIFQDKIKFIVFLESDGYPVQVFNLEKDEYLMVYNNIDGEIFNTDSIAFLSLIKKGKRLGLFCTSYSPYSYLLSKRNEVLNDLDMTQKEVLNRIKDFINNACDEFENTEQITTKNTLIVRFL